jgi:hypothetical protein
VSPARNSARDTHFRCPTRRASLPTGGTQRDGQCAERHGRCERRCVEHHVCPQKAAAHQPKKDQQMVPVVAESVPGRQLPVIALVNTCPSARYPIASVAPLAAAKNIAAPFRSRMSCACSPEGVEANLSREWSCRQGFRESALTSSPLTDTMGPRSPGTSNTGQHNLHCDS